MSSARCSCGECGGIALLPVGTVISFRGRPARVSAWAKQDHWNVPCIDAEGGVGLCRDMLDGGPGYTREEVEIAALSCANRARSGDAVERARHEREHGAWADLARRLAAGATGNDARLNPGIALVRS